MTHKGECFAVPFKSRSGEPEGMAIAAPLCRSWSGSPVNALLGSRRRSGRGRYRHWHVQEDADKRAALLQKMQGHLLANHPASIGRCVRRHAYDAGVRRWHVSYVETVLPMRMVSRKLKDFPAELRLRRAWRSNEPGSFCEAQSRHQQRAWHAQRRGSPAWSLYPARRAWLCRRRQAALRRQPRQTIKRSSAKKRVLTLRASRARLRGETGRAVLAIRKSWRRSPASSTRPSRGESRRRPRKRRPAGRPTFADAVRACHSGG